jgi:hypothetical protein
MQDPRPPGGAARELDRRLDRLRPGAREHRVAEVLRRAREQLLGQDARQQRDPELREVRRVRCQRRFDLRPHARVVAPDREDAVAGEHVEVAIAAGVDQVRALGAAPAAVEPQRAQDPPELRVQMAVVERQLLARARLQQRRDVDARHAPIIEQRCRVRPRRASRCRSGRPAGAAPATWRCTSWGS